MGGLYVYEYTKTQLYNCIQGGTQENLPGNPLKETKTVKRTMCCKSVAGVGGVCCIGVASNTNAT